LLVTLEEVKIEFRDGDSEQREKASTADSVMGKVYNAVFLLSLSFLVDIYTVYSSISRNLQVNMIDFQGNNFTGI
jgi:hypothetical protein